MRPAVSELHGLELEDATKHSHFTAQYRHEWRASASGAFHSKRRCALSESSFHPRNVITIHHRPCAAGKTCPQVIVRSMMVSDRRPSLVREVSSALGYYEYRLVRLVPMGLLQGWQMCPRCRARKTRLVLRRAAFCQPSASSILAWIDILHMHRGTSLLSDWNWPCLCRPRYEFFDDFVPVFPFEDSTIDCQPKVFRRCSRSEIRMQMQLY